ncbi:MAG: glycosyltransferase family 4 protein [Acidimicrobiales bacterium]
MATDVTARPTRQPVPARPIRVLHVVSRSQRRGAELVALELADELDRLGHRNRVVALGPAFDGRREPGLVPLGTSRGQRPPDLVVGAWRLRRLLATEPADVVLAHGGWAAQVVALAVPRRGPLLVWQRILGLPDKVWRSGRRRRWLTAVARRFDAAVALIAEQEDELRRLGYREPVWVIPNFRKADRFRAIDRDAARARLRAELGVSEGTPLVGFVGHLIRQKRPDRALEALARLWSQGCGAHLVVAGSGPLRTDLDARAHHLGVDGAVTFLGQRDDVEWVLAGVDLALLTSEAEGIPGVAIEALMAGCPMVSVPVGGVAHVVEHDVTGLIVGGDEPAVMAEAVARLLADDEARRAMSRESRARTDRFSASAAAAVYAERFRESLARR